jgi:HPt (histidine-containing phosphotransfer) domain-containing protein
MGVRVVIDPWLVDVVPWYLDQRRAEVLGLRQASARADWAGVARLGHNLKGTGAGYGFDGLTAIGARLEAFALAGDAAGVAACLDDYAAYMADLEVVHP